MATSYTSLLGLALPVTGELQGTWGDTVNNSITSLLDTAVAGTTTLSTDGDVTLTTTTGASNQARQAILLCSGARTAQRTITAPAQSKIYTVINATTGGYSVKVVGAGPTTGVTVVAGESALIAWNGSDFIKISNTGGAASFTNVTVSGTTTLSGLTASTALALDASKNVVSVTNTGTGNNVLSASPTLTGTVAGASLQLSSLTSGRVTYAGASGLLQDSANLAFDGTTLTANALTTTSTVTINGGTANGVAYLNGSKVLTTGSALTFDGTNLAITQSGNPTLTVKSTGAGNDPKIYLTADTNSFVLNGAFSPATDRFAVQYNSGELFCVESTGNFGIGTSSPSQKLEVSGSSQAGVIYERISNSYGSGGSNGSGTGLQFYGWDAGVSAVIASLREAQSYSPSYLSFQTFGGNGDAGSNTLAERMRIDGRGNLGLGVTPSAWGTGASVKGFQMPGVSLWGYGGTNAYLNANAYYNGTNRIYTGNGYATEYEQSGGNHVWKTAPSGTAGNAISFTQAMTLDASGNLGIGTSSPGAKLDAAGNIRVSYSASAANASLIANNTSSAASSTSQIIATNDASRALRIQYSSSGGIGGSALAGGFTGEMGQIFTDNNYPLSIGTGGVARLNIDTSGNLGLGVTPSAWSLSGLSAMQIRNGGLYGYDVTEVGVTGNCYYGSSAWRYIGSGQATRATQVNGQHLWYTAASGTAGNAISFTQAMTLDASGKLLVGTTTAEDFRLAVRGSGMGGILATAPSGYNGIAHLFGISGVSNGYQINCTSGNAISHVWSIGGGAEAARIDSSGNLLVGTTSGSNRLTVLTSSTYAATFNTTTTTSSSTGISIGGYANAAGGLGGSVGIRSYHNHGATGASAMAFEVNGATEVARIDSSGNLLVGTTSAGTVGAFICPATYSYTTGSGANVFVDSSGRIMRSTSSLKYKTDVQDATHGLSDVLGLRSVTYKSKEESDGDKVFGGLIAEEVHAAGLSEFVQYADDGTPDAISYGPMVALCIKAIQEQQAIINQINAKLEAQAAEIAALKSSN